MTFEQFSAVFTPQRCMTGVKIAGAWNLGMAIANIFRFNAAHLGLNVAATAMCIGSYYLFRNVREMMDETKKMEQMRVALEADLWELQHGKSYSDQ